MRQTTIQVKRIPGCRPRRKRGSSRKKKPFWPHARKERSNAGSPLTLQGAGWSKAPLMRRTKVCSGFLSSFLLPSSSERVFLFHSLACAESRLRQMYQEEVDNGRADVLSESGTGYYAGLTPTGMTMIPRFVSVSSSTPHQSGAARPSSTPVASSHIPRVQHDFDSGSVDIAQGGRIDVDANDQGLCLSMVTLFHLPSTSTSTLSSHTPLCMHSGSHGPRFLFMESRWSKAGPGQRHTEASCGSRPQPRSRYPKR